MKVAPGLRSFYFLHSEVDGSCSFHLSKENFVRGDSEL